MQRSSLVLYDMAFLYLPLHGCTHREFFNHYPILGWLEAQIYSMEIALEQGGQGRAEWPALWSEKRACILALLAAERLESALIDRFLDDVGAYFSLEWKWLDQGRLTHDEAVRAVELRPADMWLLHTTLMQRLDTPPDDVLFNLLWPLEVLWNLEANINEQAEDRAAGRFNTYHLFAQLHGAEAPTMIAAEQSRLNVIYQDRMRQAPAPLVTRVQEFVEHYREAYKSVAIPTLATN